MQAHTVSQVCKLTEAHHMYSYVTYHKLPMWLCYTLALIWWPREITILPVWILRRQSIFAFQATRCYLNSNLPLPSFLHAFLCYAIWSHARDCDDVRLPLPKYGSMPLSCRKAKKNQSRAAGCREPLKSLCSRKAGSKFRAYH